MNDTAPTEEQELPRYVIEGARSSRSKCKICRRKIEKGVLRIGILISGPYGVGYLWHHLRCAARRRFGDVEEAYRLEAWNEAKDPPAKVPDMAELKKLVEQAEQRKRERKTIPYVEMDPSGRAACKQCGERIEKGTMRIVLGKEVQFGNQVRVGPLNVHPGCAAAATQADDCANEPAELAAELRANSTGVAPATIDEVLAQVGDLSQIAQPAPDRAENPDNP